MRRRTLLCLLALVVAACGQAPAAASDGTARILLGAPSTLDPAAQGDAGSAAVTAQLFETLTTFDADRELRPALAASWRVEEDGRRIVFELRPGLDVLRRDAAACRRTSCARGCGSRSGGAVAAREPDARRRGRRRPTDAAAVMRPAWACARTTTAARSRSS